MNDSLLRTFVAIPVPKEIGVIQEKLIDTIPKNSGKVKWVRPTNIHLTLQFLGPTPERSLEPINSALDKIASGHTSFNLSLTGIGCFPKPSRPRVLWLGLGKDIDLLINLVQSLEPELADLGFPSEERNFVPHITLARIKYPQKKTPDVSRFLSFEFDSIEWRVKYFHFMQSELFSNGAVYTILGTHFLQD